MNIDEIDEMIDSDVLSESMIDNHVNDCHAAAACRYHDI